MAHINSSWYTSNTDVWATPIKVFEELNNEFHFTLDPCAIAENAKCPKFYTPEDDGLMQDWGGGDSILQSTIFANETMGREMFIGSRKGKYKGCDADTGKNGYKLFPRLYLS